MRGRRRGLPGLADHRILVDGRRFHALVSRRPLPATAPTVVFVHGLIVSGRYLAPTAELLAPQCHVAVPDLPGFGASEAPDHVLDVVELADALHRFLGASGVTRAVLVGHSMGCQVAAHLAVGHPGAVEKVVLVAPTFDPQAGGAVGTAARWFRNAAHEPLSVYRVTTEDLIRCGARRGLRTYLLGLDDRLEDQLVHLDVPTLVVRGSADIVAPERWAERVASLAPGAEVVVVPGARHLVNWTHPAELAAVVAAFIFRRP